MKKIFLLFLIAFIAGTGCKKDSYPVRQETLTGTSWMLAYIQETATNEVTFYPETEPRKISVTFHGFSNVISFKGICNTGEGTYLFSSQSGEVAVNDLASTKVACENAEWETYTIQSLNNAYRYMIDGDNLLIYSNGRYNLFFVRD
jgi:heat shock protein HslJ